MNVLLDTHSLLWALYFPGNLGKRAFEVIGNESNDIYVSAASLWEIEIKHQKRPDSMPYSAAEVREAIGRAGYRIIPIAPRHIESLGRFISQNIHNDPFDHLLLATAFADQLTLLTHDSVLPSYRGVAVEHC